VVTTRVTPSRPSGWDLTVGTMDTFLREARTLAAAGISSRFPAAAHLTPRLTAGVAAAVVLLVVGYWVSLRLRPYAVCRRCQGYGKVRGQFFTWGRAFCRKCGGTGCVPRLGTHLLAPSHRPRMPHGLIQ
jgi:hypothetical protein